MLTINILTCLRPGLDHIFIRLDPAPPTPPSLGGLLARTCVRTLPRWEPMRRYLVTVIKFFGM